MNPAFPTRRRFIMNGLLPATVSALAPRIAHSSFTKKLRVGLVGCGGRGTGAVGQVLEADPDTVLTAMGDVFEDRLASSRTNLLNKRSAQVNCPDDHVFLGLDSYKQVIALCDVIVFATPPAFRPLHFEECVRQGRHAFMEKPLGVDAPGLRKVLEASRMAKQKGLTCVAGVNRRFTTVYQQLVPRLQEGMIGQITSMEANWLGGGVWVKDKQVGESELDYQLRNWIHFTWLSGEPCLDQLMHNLDVCLWAKGQLPVSATGVCGRAQQGAELNLGDGCDFFALDYAFSDGCTLKANAHHWKNAPPKISEEFLGTKGRASLNPLPSGTRVVALDGTLLWSNPIPGKPTTDPYLAEQVALMQSIRANQSFNNVEPVTMSNFALLLGRMAAYSGRKVTWDEALNSTERFCPEHLSKDTALPTLPTKYGDYPVPARPLRS